MKSIKITVHFNIISIDLLNNDIIDAIDKLNQIRQSDSTFLEIMQLDDSIVSEIKLYLAMFSSIGFMYKIKINANNEQKEISSVDLLYWRHLLVKKLKLNMSGYDTTVLSKFYISEKKYANTVEMLNEVKSITKITSNLIKNEENIDKYNENIDKCNQYNEKSINDLFTKFIKPNFISLQIYELDDYNTYKYTFD